MNALVAALGALLLAPAPAAAPKIVEWSLPNGLQVAYLQVHRAPVVALEVWVRFGTKDEPAGQRGAARLLERLMFAGSERVPAGEHARLIQRLGGSSGAFGDDDVTVFHEVLPRAHLDFALLLEAERLRRLLFRPSRIAGEKEALKEEARLGLERDPLPGAIARLRAVAFTAHPYRYARDASLAELEGIAPEDLKRTYDLYYQPGNVLLVIVGDVAEDEARAAVDRHFGPIPRAPEPPRPAREAKEPPQTEPRRLETTAATATATAAKGIVIGAWKGPEARSPDLVPLRVAVSILADGESSRLHQRLVRREKLGVAAGADLLETEDPGLVYAYGVHVLAEQADKIESALIAEAERLGREQVSARELDKAKHQLGARGTFAQGDVGSLARLIGTAKLVRGDAAAWMHDQEAVLKVTAADVQRVARAYLQKTSLTVVRVPPRGGR